MYKIQVASSSHSKLWWDWSILPISNLYLCTNISSLPSHFDDLKYLVKVFKTSPKYLEPLSVD